MGALSKRDGTCCFDCSGFKLFSIEGRLPLNFIASLEFGKRSKIKVWAALLWIKTCMISSEGGSSELRYVGKFTNDDDNLQNIRKIYLRTYFFPLLEIDFIRVWIKSSYLGFCLNSSCENRDSSIHANLSNCDRAK